MSLVPQLALGIFMFMQLNECRSVTSHFQSVSSLIPSSARFLVSSLALVVLYPAMKRVINYPQAVLGKISVIIPYLVIIDVPTPIFCNRRT
ncbi:hypothetical protein EV702DRAFT_535056 [Suillus placidus]|uniref:Uncharacterized protein n=1 Tax=Suillus placidus TaxID=48579 RepID=A0A9P6ZRC8_9AGAM|nr:hypothetical protein EV702DRAFT_535056 [Suillus placidus]